MIITGIVTVNDIIVYNSLVFGKNIWYIWYHAGGNRRCVVAKVLDCDVAVNKFELQSFYYVHFRTNILGKYMKPLPPAVG